MSQLRKMISIQYLTIFNVINGTNGTYKTDCLLFRKHHRGKMSKEKEAKRQLKTEDKTFIEQEINLFRPINKQFL
jgi:hypothetical protein